MPRVRRSVQDEDVEFDHVIPFSKGGSSDESNVRLLCKTCNRKRGANFEERFLVDTIRDHLVEPASIELLEWLLHVAAFGRAFVARFSANPKPEDYARQFSCGKISNLETAAASSFQNIDELFRGKRPTDLPARLFRALQTRWGHRDGQIHPVKEVSDRFDCSIAELIAGERDVIRRLGWTMRRGAQLEKKWSRL
ncbi:MAG: HNH endonuclease [Bryobacteraceae bacterium]